MSYVTSPYHNLFYVFVTLHPPPPPPCLASSPDDRINLITIQTARVISSSTVGAISAPPTPNSAAGV